MMAWYFIVLALGVIIGGGSFSLAFFTDAVQGGIEGVGLALILLGLMALGAIMTLVGVFGWILS